jgi:hypothetical protein
VQTVGVRLTDEELVLLDGQCSEKVQRDVDGAKARLSVASQIDSDIPPEHRTFISRVVEEAENSGCLTFERWSLHKCDVCGRRAGYASYKRNSRYHRKGDPDYSKPLTFPGFEFAKRFVVSRGYATVGCCQECFNDLRPHLVRALENVKAELPERLMGYPSKWRRWDNMKCKSCGWQGHKGEMGELPAMFEGYYRGQCPECGAKNNAFGPMQIKTVDGFTLVATEGV